MRRRSSWQLASCAGLILALSSGCKSSHSGGGSEEDAGEQDGGPNTNPDGGEADGGGGSDAGPIDGAVGNPDGMVVNPDGSTTNPDGSTTNPDGSTDNPDSGGPMGIADTDSIDFGLSNCGGDAPESKTFKLTNTGAVAITYTVTLSDSTAFSIQGATGASKSGTIAPGTDASITLGASAVPASATANVAIRATATITTNLPAPNNSFVIPLSITPQGAHLQLSPSQGAEWLLVQTGEDAGNVALTLQNTGNLAASATVTQPDKDAFKLYDNGTTTQSSSLAVPAATGSTPGALMLTASFMPLANGGYVSSAPLAVTGPVCNGGPAASLTAIPFQGAATSSGLSVRATPLAARVNCGESANLPKTTYTVTNLTANAMTIAVSTIKDPGDSPFTLSTNALSLASTASATFDVTLKASEVPSSAVPGTILTDRVQLTPSDPLLSQRIFPLSTTVQGAVLTISDPGAGAFNGANNVTTIAQNLTISNSGNLAATPTFTITPGDYFTQTAELTPAQVPGGSSGSLGTSTIGVTFRPPVNDPTMRSAALQMVAGAGDVICGALPGPVTLSGTPTTPGFSLTSASPVQFTSLGGAVQGAVDCPVPGNGPLAMTPAPTQTVTFQNFGNTALAWTATLDNTTAFSLSAASGSIPAVVMGNPPSGDSIIVTPAALPFPPSLDPDVYSGNLTITTNVPGDSPHVIPLRQRARGAILTAATVNGGFGDVNVNFVSDPLELFTVTNSGNADATLKLTSTLATSATTTGPIYSLDGQDVTKASSPLTWTESLTTDTPVTVTGVFHPTLVQGTSADSDLTTSTVSTVLSATTPVCAALPADPQIVTGTGTNAVVGVTGNGTLNFALHTCGATRAADPQTVIISNYGNQALDITGLTLTTGTWFSAYIGQQGNTTGTVPAANFQTNTPGTAVAVVVPKIVPGPNTGAPMTLSDTLHIATAIGNQTQPDTTVSISEPITCTKP